MHNPGTLPSLKRLADVPELQREQVSFPISARYRQVAQLADGIDGLVFV